MVKKGFSDKFSLIIRSQKTVENCGFTLEGHTILSSHLLYEQKTLKLYPIW